MQTTSGIHCKVATQTETRRFSFEGRTFDALAETICQLLGLSKDSVVIKYTDDENDLVTISSDEELNFAIASANGGLLRLTASEKVKPSLVKDNAPAAGSPSQVNNPCKDAETPCREKWLNKKAQDPVWLQNRLEACSRKRQFLQTRLSQLDASHPNYGKWVSKLQWKIQSLSATIDALSSKAKDPKTNQNLEKPACEAAAPVLPTMEEVSREMKSFKEQICAARFGLRQANLQLQLRRTELKAAQHEGTRREPGSAERIAELKRATQEAKAAENAKKAELKAIMQRFNTCRNNMKAIKRQKDLANKCAKKKWDAPVVIELPQSEIPQTPLAVPSAQASSPVV